MYMVYLIKMEKSQLIFWLISQKYLKLYDISKDENLCLFYLKKYKLFKKHYKRITKLYKLNHQDQDLGFC